jgi:hypothetical protein
LAIHEFCCLPPAKFTNAASEFFISTGVTPLITCCIVCPAKAGVVAILLAAIANLAIFCQNSSRLSLGIESKMILICLAVKLVWKVLNISTKLLPALPRPAPIVLVLFKLALYNLSNSDVQLFAENLVGSDVRDTSSSIIFLEPGALGA